MAELFNEPKMKKPFLFILAAALGLGLNYVRSRK